MRHLVAAGSIVAAFVFCAACQNGEGKANKDTGATDVAVDGSPTDSASETGGHDLGSETDSAVLPDSAMITSKKTKIVVTFDPFDIAIHRDGGERKTKLHDSDEPAFDGLAIARATSYTSSRFFNPKLTENDGVGDEMTWYSARRVDEVKSLGDDRVALTLTTSDKEGKNGPTLDFVARKAEHAVAIEVTAPEKDVFVHTALTWDAANEEGFYGLGEHFDALDVRGTIREMQIQAESNSESAINEVHVPIPFYMSTRDYAMFVEDRHPAAFDVGATESDAVRATWNSRDVTYRLFVDDSPMNLVETYAEMTGMPAHVPYWALAPQWWRNETDGQSEVIDDVKRGRKADIPSTLVWIDRPWSSYYHNWKFNSANFPNPKKMFDELHDYGHRILLHHSPQMNQPGTSDIKPMEDNSEMLYSTYQNNDWLVEFDSGSPVVLPWGGGQGGFVDYSHPDAVDHVQKLIERVTKWGAVGTKMDWDEYLQPNIGGVRVVMEFENGETNMTMHDWYSALYHKAIIEGFDQALGEPSFHISRTGAPGDQKWNTCIWPGDLDNDFTRHTRGPSKMQEEWNVGGLPSAIMANQSLGMSGYPCFGSDIGGFRNGDPGEEVLMRWLAFGTFNAVMQLGGGGGTHMAWTADSTYSQKVLDVTRKYFKLRMELFPYIFEYLGRSEETGRPLVRSMFLAYPDDAEARTHEDQFMFGPDMLVAPIHTKGATSRELYLPKGDWIDFWTGERKSGGQTVTRKTPIDVIPVYLRAGTILPMAPEGIDTLVGAKPMNVTSYSDNKEMKARLVPGPETEKLDLFNGVGIETKTDSNNAFHADVALGSPDSSLPKEIRFAPNEITLLVEASGTSFASGPSTVAFKENGSTTNLSKGMACTQCYSFDASRKLLTIHLDRAGEVVVE